MKTYDQMISIHPWIEIAKPRLVLLVLWTVAVGFVMAQAASLDFGLLAKTLFGAAFVAAGSMVLNQYLERDADARMKRTQNRPLPSGRIRPKEALLFGLFLSLAGIVILVTFVNFLTAFLAALTLGTYLFLYTPLKRKTPWCTFLGAIPGAIPPMLGWTAVRGGLEWPAWILFLILYAWQLPHFFALAWIYREDYTQAGFPMVSVIDPTGERLAREVMVASLALSLLSLIPAVTGMTGFFYYGGALLLGIWFLASSFQVAFQLESRSRAFFGKSVIYLSVLLLLMILDRQPL